MIVQSQETYQHIQNQQQQKLRHLHTPYQGQQEIIIFKKKKKKKSIHKKSVIYVRFDSIYK